jgi:hypothetical protein
LLGARSAFSSAVLVLRQDTFRRCVWGKYELSQKIVDNLLSCPEFAMNFAFLGPPSHLRNLCMEAVARLLAAVEGGSWTRPIEGTDPSVDLHTEPQLVYGVYGDVVMGFNVDQYLQNNADLAQHFSQTRPAMTHFAHHGWHEGRSWAEPKDARPEHLVIGAENPGTQVLAAWRDKAELAIALDDPIATARAMTVNSSATRREAITRVTLSFCALHDRILDSTIPFLSPARSCDLAQQLAMLVAPLRLQGAERWIEHYLSNCIVPRQEARLGENKSPSPEFAEPDDFALAAALGGYAELLERRQVRAVTWPCGMFYRPDAPLQSPTMPIDLSGPARGILFGPHLCLPSGRWRCDATFTSSGNRHGSKFAIDIYQRGVVDRTLALHDFTLPERGAFTLQLPFETSAPEAPIENRFVLREGLIGGLFQLSDVKFLRRQ